MTRRWRYKSANVWSVVMPADATFPAAKSATTSRCYILYPRASWFHESFPIRSVWCASCTDFLRHSLNPTLLQYIKHCCTSEVCFIHIVYYSFYVVCMVVVIIYYVQVIPLLYIAREHLEVIGFRCFTTSYSF